MSVEAVHGDVDTDVVVIGAGPVGLSTALQLGRTGISCLVLERRATLSRHPKAGGIHARTMEIFRQWGLADEIRARGPRRRAHQWGWMTRLAGIEIGSIQMGGTPQEQALFASQSPELTASVGQDLLEPVLAEAAERFDHVRVRFGAEMTDFAADGDGVSVTYVESGVSSTVRARYLVGADGTRSAVRRGLGIGEHGQQSLGQAINVRFRAEIEPFRAGRDYGLFWIINPETQGAFLAGDGSDWRYNFEAAPGVDPRSYTHEQCADLIRAAIGADIPIEIVSILYWDHDQAVTDRWRSGRVFLAGDASHRFPPHGGFGMNSGIQDSANLAWKLHAVLRWGAGDRLLDTYEQERIPVAEFNGAQCMENTRKMEETGWLAGGQELSEIETAAGAALRQRIAAAIPRQRGQFFSQGQQFGLLYDSDAVVPDGTVPVESTVSNYVANARPGARAPHVWVRRDGRRQSTVDLLGPHFVLLTGPADAAWREAVRLVAAGGDTPVIRHHAFGVPDGLEVEALDETLALYGIGRDGAVLVRPDGYVGFRSADAPEHPYGALATALTQILDLRGGPLHERAALVSMATS